MTDHVPAQNRTLRAEQAESGTTDAGEDQGARETRWESPLWLAVHSVYDRHDDQRPLNHVNVVEWVEAVEPILAAEMADAVSEAQAEVERAGRDRDGAIRRASTEIRLRDAAEAERGRAERELDQVRAEVERLRAELSGLEADCVSAYDRGRRSAEAGIRALADEWDLTLTPPRLRYEVAAKQLRALLAPSPAAATGEADDEPDGCRLNGCHPVPVSSGEAGTGEAVYAADGGYVIRKDNVEDLRAEVSRLATEALKLKGAQVALAGLGEAVKDLCWKATPMGETADGDTYAYILPKGTVHRLIGVAQGVGIHAAFRAIPAPVVTPSAEGSE